MKNVLFLVLALLFTSCGSDAVAPEGSDSVPMTPLTPAQPVVAEVDPSDRTYVPGQRIGKITASTTPEDLVAFYGAENVVKDSIHLGEGYFVDGYRLFPGTSSELAVMYPNELTKMKDLQITIDFNSTDWKSAQNGIAIGTTFEELERYNGHPFTFMGFDWDYGGVVTDWQSGALQDHRIRLSYEYEKRGEVEVHNTIIGDQKVTSSNPYLDGLNIAVKQIIVRLPQQ